MRLYSDFNVALVSEFYEVMSDLFLLLSRLYSNKYETRGQRSHTYIVDFKVILFAEDKIFHFSD